MASKHPSDSEDIEVTHSEAYCFSSRSTSNLGLLSSEGIPTLISSVKQTDEIPIEVREKVIDWLVQVATSLESDNTIRIITVGETGVGKSALLNVLIGTDKFKEAKPLSMGAIEVEECVVDIQGIKIIVYDCPGLQDGTKNEEAYLKNLQEKCPAKDIDLLLYCMRIDETRTAGHMKGIKLVTEHLGKEIWKHAIVVLTFANILQIEYSLDNCSESESLEGLERRISLWKVEVQKALRKYEVEEKVVNEVKVLPAGHWNDESLPGRKYWLSDFWGHVLTSMRKKNQASLIAIGGIRGFRDQTESDLKGGQTSTKNPIVITNAVQDGIGESIGVKELPKKLIAKLSACNIL